MKSTLALDTGVTLSQGDGLDIYQLDMETDMQASTLTLDAGVHTTQPIRYTLTLGWKLHRELSNSVYQLILLEVISQTKSAIRSL